MPAFLEPVALIMVGWLFGLLGPAIVDAIKQEKEHKRGRIAIITELEEFATTIATAAYRVKMSHGTMDREFLTKMKSVIDEYPQSASVAPLREGVETFLGLDDVALSALAQHGANPPQVGLALQHYPVPLLDSRVSALMTFDTAFQRHLLQLRREITILDALVDRSEKFMDLTFTGIDATNRRLASESHDSACANYATRAIRIVEKIRAIKSEV